MTSVNNLIVYILGAFVFFSLVIGAGYFFRTSVDRILSACFSALPAAVGLFALPGLLSGIGLELHTLPWAILSAVPYALGPLLYIYGSAFSGLFTAEETGRMKHFIAVPIAAAVLVLLGGWGAVERHQLDKMIIACLMIHSGSYIVYTLKKHMILFTAGGGRIAPAASMLFLLVVHLVALSAVTAAELTGECPSAAARLLAGVVPLVHFFAAQRVPRLAGYCLRQQNRRQEFSPQKRVVAPDGDSLGKRVMELVEKERMYRYEELTVAMMAGALDVPSYVLSQYINTAMGQSFSVFVNSYRIRDAKRLLIHEPDKSVLTIAFEVGFSSKASFNRVFKQMTTLSPSEYRKFFTPLSREQFY